MDTEGSIWYIYDKDHVSFPCLTPFTCGTFYLLYKIYVRRPFALLLGHVLAAFQLGTHENHNSSFGHPRSNVRNMRDIDGMASLPDIGLPGVA